MPHTFCPASAQVIIDDPDPDWPDLQCCDKPELHERLPRIWAWGPSLYWFGWRSLKPAFMATDEHGRRTIAIGWAITGRVIIALWVCGCIECNYSRRQTAGMMREERDGE